MDAVDEAPNGPRAQAVLAGLARGRALFNRADFWASHEAWESAWHAAPPGARECVQGLIQAGAAFHKYVVQDNPDGARRLLAWALDKLDRAPEGCLGLDLDPFRGHLREWSDHLRDAPVAAGSVVGFPRLDWSDTSMAGCITADAVTLYEVRAADQRAVLVAVEADGHVGWGECRMAWETYGLWSSLVEALAPALLTERVSVPSELGVLWSGVVANPCAAAGLEAALWDLWARRAGLPLAAALGIAARPVPLAGRVSGVEPAALRASAARRLADGYRHLILPARPNADRRVLPGLMADLGVQVSIDLGGAYRPSDFKALEALDGLGAVCLAQPVPPWDLAGAVTLSRWLGTPVSLGGWATEEAAAGALSLAAADALHVDPGVCGLTEAARIAGLAAGRRVPLWVAGTAATTVGAAADLALAAHAGVTWPSDLGQPEPVGDGISFAPDGAGMAQPGAAPGLGVAPTAEWLDRTTVRRAVLRA